MKNKKNGIIKTVTLSGKVINKGFKVLIGG